MPARGHVRPNLAACIDCVAARRERAFQVRFGISVKLNSSQARVRGEQRSDVQVVRDRAVVVNPRSGSDAGKPLGEGLVIEARDALVASRIRAAGVRLLDADAIRSGLGYMSFSKA